MKKPFTLDDYFGVQGVSSAQISPDGSRAAYVVRKVDLEKNRGRTSIHLVDAESGETIRLTNGPGHDHSPHWSPDGKRIAFLSDRKDREQVWIIRADGGEAEQLTDSKTPVQDLAWSPDGTHVAYRAVDAPTKEEEKKKKRKEDPRLVERDEKPSRLWVIGTEDRKPRRLTRGRRHVVGFCWSPDGRQLAFAEASSPLADDGWACDLAVVCTADRRRRPLVQRPGFNGSPEWSPDGKRIAFISQGGQDDRLASRQLWVVPARGGEPRNVTPREEDLQGGHIWDPDGRWIYFSAGRGVNEEIRRVSVASGRTQCILDEPGVTAGYSMSLDGRVLALVHQSAGEPPQVYATPLPRVELRRLTDENAQLKGYRLPRKSTVRWRSGDGLEVEGLLIRPRGYRRGKRYPMLVVAHGGPTGAFMNTFEPGPPGPYPYAVFAERGYVVLMPNPRGSVNYGEAFKRANYRDWGGGDYQDIMSGVDAMVDRGIADPNRLGMMGWSYGGYMTAWTVSQTNRFKAVSVGAGICNAHSMYGSNDISGYLRAFFGSLPWRDPEAYASRSALTYADQVRSPVLIQHGERDVRVPFTQALEFHQALKERGVPVTFVAYPRQGHGIGEPRLILDAMTRNLEWFDKWVLGKKPRVSRRRRKLSQK